MYIYVSMLNKLNTITQVKYSNNIVFMRFSQHCTLLFTYSLISIFSSDPQMLRKLFRDKFQLTTKENILIDQGGFPSHQQLGSPRDAAEEGGFHEHVNHSTLYDLPKRANSPHEKINKTFELQNTFLLCPTVPVKFEAFKCRTGYLRICQ